MTDTDEWLELWAEFDFAEPDAIGQRGATPVQLRAAVNTAEASLDIATAVVDNVLKVDYATDHVGNEKIRAYRLNLAGGVSA